MSSPLALIMDGYPPTRYDRDYLTIEEMEAAIEVPSPSRGSPARNVPAADDMTWGEGQAPLRRPHTQIHRRCGACQMPFRQYDRMVASKCAFGVGLK